MTGDRKSVPSGIRNESNGGGVCHSQVGTDIFGLRPENKLHTNHSYTECDMFQFLPNSCWFFFRSHLWSSAVNTCCHLYLASVGRRCSYEGL